MAYQIQQRYETPCRILKAKSEKVNGVIIKSYEEGDVFFCSAKAYGGTEGTRDNLLVIEDTLTIETYFREDVKSDCLLELLDDNSKWEILNTPEQINREKKTLNFKVRRLKGGA